MAHDHEVKVTGAIFEVDPITRKVTSGEEKKLISGDHESTRFGFRMPRYINGHDMSLCQEVTIHSINLSKDGKMKVEDICAVDNYGVDPEDEESVTWTWLVKKSATTHEGHTGFGLCFRCLTDGAIDYDWNTELCENEIKIGKGQHNEESIDEMYFSIMQQWWDKFMSTGGASEESIKQAVNDYLDENPPQAGATPEQAEQIEKNRQDISKLSNPLFDVDCTINPMTMEVAEISHYSEDMINAYNEGKLVRIKAIFLGMNVRITSELSLIEDNLVYFYPVARINMGTGLKNYLLRFLVRDSSVTVSAHEIPEGSYSTDEIVADVLNALPTWQGGNY